MGTDPCDLYVPGHLVHFIQASRAAQSDDPVSWGRLERVDDDGVITVEFIDRAERYRNHRPDLIRQVARRGDKVRVAERWNLLGVHRRFEQLILVCIQDAHAPWRPCSVAPEPASAEDAAARLHTRGGFLVPGHVALGWLGDDSVA